MKLTYFFLGIILLVASVLRFYKVDQVPYGLYIDEVSIGYNAYTILTKGVDEHGATYPLFFQAFGEYKMPIPIYITSVSLALFGKNDFAVRFPSALFGTLTVFLLYSFVKQLLSFSVILASERRERVQNPQRKRFWSQNFVLPQNDEAVALLSAFLLAITPWHIQFSRAYFEANIALFFYLLGGYLFLEFLQTKKKVLIVVSFLSILLTAYIYNAYRLVAPITIIVCSFIIYKSFPKIRKYLLVTGFALLVLLLPMILFSLTPGGTERFASQSAFAKFSDFSPIQKIVTYPAIFVENYLSSITGDYVFVKGDGNGRHTVTGMGNLFRWEFLFFLPGFYFLLKKRKEFSSKVIFFLFFLAPVTGALTNPSPHTLRLFLLVIPLTIIIAYGCVTLWEKKFLFKKILFACVFLFALFEFIFYLHMYYVHYPIRTAPDWGSAYKELFVEIEKEQHKYSRVVVNDNVGTVNIYRNFYNDKLEYELVNDGWKKPSSEKNEKILYITSSSEKRNYLLNKIPHKLIKNIMLPSYHNGIFAQLWEI